MFTLPAEKVTVYSKRLSYALRHGAVKKNLNISSDGFVLLDDVVSLGESFRTVDRVTCFGCS